jgi:hypothetical protein
MIIRVLPYTVRAERVEALSFFCINGVQEGQPFDTLRANGVCGNGRTQ